jgi:hypothetical protein
MCPQNDAESPVVQQLYRQCKGGSFLDLGE